MDTNFHNTTSQEPHPETEHTLIQTPEAHEDPYDTFDSTLAWFASEMDHRHRLHNADDTYIDDWRKHPEALEDELIDRILNFNQALADPSAITEYSDFVARAEQVAATAALAALTLMKIADSLRVPQSSD
jgi:hypothetical protein